MGDFGGGGGMRRPLSQFLTEDSQIKLYLNMNLHHYLVNFKKKKF